MSVKGKTSAAPPPLLKNAAAAPFIYFDNAPLYGVAGTGIEIELTAATIIPKTDGSIAREAVCVGHLRCSPQAAVVLADSLQKAVVMYQKQVQASAEAAVPADKTN